ncbi:hypothetical protein T492DRAFT_991530 [Pavlovales sp. CCMP2436]|nr:hypothetical protein T492DRAFT_991530 [Pavlovales sp. CCMP2436]|mmetsp:Transcript_29613/g.74496  ORF Transcript_29613/g.74496 Transcript_29613/m.74496 type:complete len:411 (-) Transcript_29613:51-1283(-)
MELHGALGRGVYSPGEVVECVVHLCATGPESEPMLRLDWIAARAHGQWRIALESGGVAARPPLLGAAPGIIGHDVALPPSGGVLTWVVRIALPSDLPPTYRSAAPARAGARERTGGGSARLEYSVVVSAQRRDQGLVVGVSLVLPFEVRARGVLDVTPTSCNPRGATGAWLAPSPSALAMVARAPPPLTSSTVSPMGLASSATAGATDAVPSEELLVNDSGAGAEEAGTVAGEAVAASRDEDEDGSAVHVELRVAGDSLGMVNLAGGRAVGNDGASPLTLTLVLPGDTALLCVAACARLQAVERVLCADGAWTAPRSVTVGECDAHIEHATLVTLTLHRPLGTPPQLSRAGPVSSAWQLVLDLAVRPRAEPHAQCSVVSWVHPVELAPESSASRVDRLGASNGVIGTVRF